MNTPEHISSKERIVRPRSGEAASTTTLPREAIATLHAEQLARLGQIERYLTVKRRETIRAKLEREHALLENIAARAERLAAATETSALVLNKSFFRLSKLDPNILE